MSVTGEAFSLSELLFLLDGRDILKISWGVRINSKVAAFGGSI